MVDDAEPDVVAVLTRAPSAGGKSRLFRALGRPGDPALLRALLLDTLDGAADPAFARVVVVTPPSACHEVADAAPGIRVIPQAEGDLGERMQGAMRDLLADGAARVAVIGSDLPEITPAPIAAAFAHLRRHPADLVLGPSRDGGYYLVAASRVPDVFRNIAWGTPSVLAETCDRARQAGLSVHLLTPLDDVDSLDDLHRLARAPRDLRSAAWARRVVAPNRRNG